MKSKISSLLFVVAAMLWGFAFSAQKEAAAVPAFTVGFVRNIFATLFLLLVIPFLDKLSGNGRRLVSKKRPLDFTKTELIGGVICGAILTIASAFQQTGLGDGTDAGKAAFITALYVVIVPLIYLLFGRRSPLNVWISVGIAVVGFYLLCIKDDFTVSPSDALVLICALIFALHIIAIDRFSPRCDGVRLAFIQFLSAFILNTVCALIFESPIAFDLIWEHILSLLFLGVFSSGIAYTLQVLGQRNLNPGVASILLSLESVFGAIGGALIFGESMTKREIIGSAIVFSAVILSQIDFKKKSKSEEKSSDL
jgi:drug/metabolite transporter (DMT)-like permease